VPATPAITGTEDVSIHCCDESGSTQELERMKEAMNGEDG
jgi:hypothetical protein